VRGFHKVTIAPRVNWFVASHKLQKKARERKKLEKKPVVYYSDKPISIKEWRAGKDSPNPKSADSLK
jgi:hypothetical protein